MCDLVSPKITKIPLGNIFDGDDLSTVAGSVVVSVTGSSNFLLAGVEEGDVLEILEGDNTGKYAIVSVTGTTATLDAPPPNTGFAQSFTVYKSFTGVTRPLVRVREIELLDSNSQPTGIKIPYGDIIDARIYGALSNRGEGQTVESYTGELLDNGSGLYRLKDLNRDFISEDVKEDYRLNLLSGSSTGSYTIAAVIETDGSGNPSPGSGVSHAIDVVETASGGTPFNTAETPVHYSMGLPSAGIARLYFLEPTTVEIDTGLLGGRLEFSEGGTAKGYRFSQVSGFPIVPAGGSGEDDPRDIRLVRSYPDGAPPYKSIVELTDAARPGVFELEIEEGDTFEIHEKIPFLTSSGVTLESIGIFGKSAGLRTTAGSSEVSIPNNSYIDFVAMDNNFPLVGQILIINEGDDRNDRVSSGKRHSSSFPESGASLGCSVPGCLSAG
jgi:hypothetical protein